MYSKVFLKVKKSIYIAGIHISLLTLQVTASGFVVRSDTNRAWEEPSSLRHMPQVLAFIKQMSGKRKTHTRPGNSSAGSANEADIWLAGWLAGGVFGVRRRVSGAQTASAHFWMRLQPI